MKFSILLASRQRLNLLTNMLNSILHTSRSREIEVLVAVDSDDNYNIEELQNRYKAINLRFFVRERSEWMHRDYINWLYPFSSGKYVIVLNDDTIFMKNSWDINGWVALENYLSDKPDGVVYGFTETGSGKELCTFPLFSRMAIDALGWVLPDERKNWGADHDVKKIYSSIGRSLYLPEIEISHISIHTGKRSRDNISYEIEKSFMTQHNVYIPIEHYVQKLSKYIKSFSVGNNTVSSIGISCILISDGSPAKAVESIINQTFKNWNLLVLNGFNYKKDSRIKSEKISGHAGWCINECFRRGLIGGHLVVCLKDTDIFYENAFATFVNFFTGSEDHVVKCVADKSNLSRKRDGDPSLMQICCRRDITNIMCPSKVLWPESGKEFYEHIKSTAKVNFLDIKIGYTEG